MSELEALRNKLALQEDQLKLLRRGWTGEERDQLAAAQARADSVAAQFGGTASAPVVGESPNDYRRRLLNTYKARSPRFKGANMFALPDSALDPVEQEVYHDAAQAARDPNSHPAGKLIPVQERDHAGRMVTRFVGDPLAWMAPFMRGGQVGRFNDPRTR